GDGEDSNHRPTVVGCFLLYRPAPARLLSASPRIMPTRLTEASGPLAGRAIFSSPPARGGGVAGLSPLSARWGASRPQGLSVSSLGRRSGPRGSALPGPLIRSARTPAAHSCPGRRSPTAQASAPAARTRRPAPPPSDRPEPARSVSPRRAARPGGP